MRPGQENRPSCLGIIILKLTIDKLSINLKYMKKSFIITISLVVALFLGIALVQAKSDNSNPSSDIERGVFVHYPHAQGLAKGAGATGDQVNDYKYNGIHWAIPAVSYKINPVNTQIPDTDVINATQLAFQEWVSHDNFNSTHIDFNYLGTTVTNTPVNPSTDGINTVSFESFGSSYPNAIAVTFYWYSRTTKTLVETDTVFNSDLPWATNGDSASYDLQNIATHEFGHWLLLGDLYSPRDWALTMYGYGYKGDTDHTLGTGDITGINKIY